MTSPRGASGPATALRAFALRRPRIIETRIKIRLGIAWCGLQLVREGDGKETRRYIHIARIS